MLMPRASHAFWQSQFHLPISHTVDSIGGCEGLRKHLKEVEDIMHRGVSHIGENTHILDHILLHTNMKGLAFLQSSKIILKQASSKLACFLSC